jgi:hypothetical protein
MPPPVSNFPYIWQDPSNPLLFNKLTYGWIDTNLASGIKPAAQDSPFTNIFNKALSSIQYSLSKADQDTINQASSATTQQQAALLNVWLGAFNSYPTGSGQPIDLVMTTIQTTWANGKHELNGARQ